MQKNLSIESQNSEYQNKNNSSKVLLEHRKNLSLSGVEEVYSSNEMSLILKLSGSKVFITGSKITI